MSTPLTSRQRAHLKSLAHELSPVVLVGSDGLTPGLHSAVDKALTDHELIKVRLGQSFLDPRKPAAAQIAGDVEAALVQLIGRVIILYRPRSPKDPRKLPSIRLPA